MAGQITLKSVTYNKKKHAWRLKVSNGRSFHIQIPRNIKREDLFQTAYNGENLIGELPQSSIVSFNIAVDRLFNKPN